jgi:hypothetical protein
VEQGREAAMQGESLEDGLFETGPDISSIRDLQRLTGRFFKKILIKSNRCVKFVRKQPPTDEISGPGCVDISFFEAKKQAIEAKSL